MTGAVLFALLAVGSASGDEFLDLIEHERCLYRRGGPPGPAGNALVVAATGPIWIVRQGDEIRVHQILVRCTGPQATTHNVDEIVVRGGIEEGLTIDERNGRFAPGATREPHGSQIEFRVDGPRIEVEGTDGPDRIVLGSPGGRTAIALDPGADRERPDYDIFETGRLPHLLQIFGGTGDDVLDARRLRRIGDDERHNLRLFGESGSDLLLGSRGSDFLLNDGPGDDLVRGGGGDDRIAFRLGHDTLFGGRGNDTLYYAAFERFSARAPEDGSDRLFGGPGRDELNDENRHPDLLDCGGGLDSVRREPHDRPAADCERTQRP